MNKFGSACVVFFIVYSNRKLSEYITFKHLFNATNCFCDSEMLLMLFRKISVVYSDNNEKFVNSLNGKKCKVYLVF